MQYGVISNWTTGYLLGDLEDTLAFGPGEPDLANWLATAYATAQTRVSSVTVNAAAYPAAWPLVLNINPGDVVTVNRRPPTGPAGQVFSVTARVISVNRTFDWAGGTAEAVIGLDYAPDLNILTCDSATYGQLNGTNILGW